RIPCSRTNEYYPVADYQRAVIVGIYQGEHELCERNIKLGEFEFLLEPPRPIEQAAILLTFHLDADDILHVSARDKLTGAAQTVVIKGSQNLERATVRRLRREARQPQPEDRDRAERLRCRQQLAGFLTEVQRCLQHLAGEQPGNAVLEK